MNSVPWEVIDGVPTHKLFIDGQCVQLSGNVVMDEPHIPCGGVKNSGIGREGGRHSMDEMTEPKWITVQMGQILPF